MGTPTDRVAINTSDRPRVHKGRLRRGLVGAVVALVTVIVLDRAALAVLVEDGAFGGKRLAPYATPVFQSSMASAVARLQAEGGRKEALLDFDAELGWEPRSGSNGPDVSYDRHGARDHFAATRRAVRDDGRQGAADAAPGAEPLDRDVSRVPGKRRILAFGCSFTHGTEVSNEDAWLAHLDRQREDLEVFNFGVAAYGLGQALLRIERRASGLAPDEVWLGLMPSAAQRPSTHFRPLLRPWTSVPWLKPRFELGADGGLVRIANPVGTVEDALALYDEPGAFDRLLAGRDPWYDAVRPAFTERPEHLLFSGRLYWTWRTFSAGARMRGLDGRGESLVPLQLAIVREARAAAEAAGATLRFLILPGPLDLPAPHGDGGVISEELLELVEAEGIATFDLSPAVLSVPEADRWAPGGHYSGATNLAVATWLASRVEGL